MENLSIEELQAKNQEGETLLHLATIPGNLERVKYLLESGLEVNAVTNFWHTPLHYAVNFGWFEIAKFLIEKGAKVNALTNFDYSPLHYAANQGRANIAKLLIEKGTPLNIQNMFGQTALHCAANHQKSEFDCKDCGSRYHYCGASYGRIEVVRLLIENKVKVHLEDEDGFTALDLAKKFHSTEIVSLLIQAQSME
ncbi:MAG: ankyrin repeat domain-containing protein [Leptospiraceae bacterium]|nr:ankyrin repeat domain-containing protein [Leptospiraceae bacterium]